MTTRTKLPGGRRFTGFTLLELMIAVAVIAILGGIGIPMYSGYIDNGREARLMHNIATVEVFQERARLRTGSYATTGLTNAAAIKAAIDWEPQAADGTTYAITAQGSGYRITATDASGHSVCMNYPQKTRC